LSFPTFNGREDPLGWLNRCEQFFRAQRTGEGDKVGLASFHMTGAAQYWYFMLERDAGVVSWPHFKALCQQRFGPAMGVNHLADLARIPFCNSVDEYIESFQARLAHTSYLTLVQQARLFSGGVPDHIRIDVELLAPRCCNAPWRWRAHTSAAPLRHPSLVPRARPGSNRDPFRFPRRPPPLRHLRSRLPLRRRPAQRARFDTCLRLR
jgi:hypothetical protein